MKSTLSITAFEPTAIRPRSTRGLLATDLATVTHRETSVRFGLGVRGAGDAAHARAAYVAVPAIKVVATANAPVRRSAPGRPPR